MKESTTTSRSLQQEPQEDRLGRFDESRGSTLGLNIGRREQEDTPNGNSSRWKNGTSSNRNATPMRKLRFSSSFSSRTRRRSGATETQSRRSSLSNAPPRRKTSFSSKLQRRASLGSTTKVEEAEESSSSSMFGTIANRSFKEVWDMDLDEYLEESQRATALEKKTTNESVPPRVVAGPLLADRLVDLEAAFRQCAVTATRKWRMKRYKNVFVGCDTVSRMVYNGLAQNRAEAVQIARSLAWELDLFKGVLKDSPFCDSYQFYRFEPGPGDANTPDCEDSVVTGMWDSQSVCSGKSQSSTFALGHKADTFMRLANVRNRRYHLRTYKSCFVGRQMVDALVENGVVETREEAVQYGQELQSQLCLFEHVCEDHCFKDEYLFFRFRQDIEDDDDDSIGSYSQMSISHSLASTRTADTVTVLAEKALTFASLAEIKDRKYKLRTYKSCFVGEQMVDALLESGVVDTREEAVEYGRELESQLQLFEHVCKDHCFKDGYLFYRFRDLGFGDEESSHDTESETTNASSNADDSKELRRGVARSNSLGAKVKARLRSFNQRKSKDFRDQFDAASFFGMVEEGQEGNDGISGQGLGVIEEGGDLDDSESIASARSDDAVRGNHYNTFAIDVLKSCMKVKTLEESTHRNGNCTTASDGQPGSPLANPASAASSSSEASEDSSSGEVCVKQLLDESNRTRSTVDLDFSCSSEFYEEVEQEQSSRAAPSSEKKIRWGSRHTREYVQCLSDNPSCSAGPPIQLDWHYKLVEVTPLEQTKDTTSPTGKAPKIDPMDRCQILLNLGYSAAEMDFATMRRQREGILLEHDDNFL